MTENKLTDKEIIQALECCADLFDCIICPCKEFCGDLGKLQQNALDLINRQQAEIERLQKLLDDKCDRCIARDKAEAYKEFAEMLKERAKANEWNGTICGLDIDNLLKEMTDKENEQHINSDSRQVEINKNAQSLVKSFAEKLKSQLSFGLEDKIPANVYSFVYITIENLVKEMVGEG